MKTSKLVSLVVIFSFIIFLPIARAEIFFNPHFIISDEDMRDFNSMSLASIQRFLEDKNSTLAYKKFEDFQGLTKPASEIIWQAAIESKISPKVLLVTLQKEQSLIEGQSPTLRQYDVAMGYRCPDSGGCAVASATFGKQIDGAAWQFSQYFERPGDWFYKVGQSYIIDNVLVIPSNQATANLYNYTPHQTGNKHFWNLWQKYFGKDFPDGTLLKSNTDPGVWYIEYGTRRLITSWGALVSRFDPKKIITVSNSDLEKYSVGPSIKFHNYSLLGLPTGEIYLVVDDELRYITSPEVFRWIGFNPEEIEPVEPADLSGYRYGEDITLESAYPTGALLQDGSTGGVYFVENGTKYPITFRDVLDVNYPNKILTQVAPDVLGQYATGGPVRFKDGELIKPTGDGKVYVISGGYRRWIKTEEAFAKFGYKWDNIIEVSDKALTLHPLGEDIE